MGKYGFSFRWLAVTSFEMRFGNTTIVSDPFITECDQTDLTWESVENCDMICLSHAHWDHITDIPRLCQKFSPKVLCGEQTALPLARWMNYNGSFVYPMYPDMELDFGDVKVRALYGRHTNLKAGINDLTARIIRNPYCVADPGMAGLQELGFNKTQVFTTMELRMKCGVGKCGRCNIGNKYVCKDGPVFRCDQLDELPNEY